VSERDPHRQDAVSEILDGLSKAPMPDGLLRRAADRWEREAAAEALRRERGPVRRPRPLRPFGPLTSLKPALVGALALVLLAVAFRNRVGIQEQALRDTAAPLMQERSQGATRRAEAAQPSVAAIDREEKEARPVARRFGGHEAKDAAPQTRMARTRAALSQAVPDALHTEAEAVRTAGHRAGVLAEGHSPPKAGAVAMPTAPSMAGVPAVIGSAFDLAYLNAEEAGGAPAEEVGVPDPRLLKLVTLAQDGEGLPDLLGVLRSHTGVQITVPDNVARRSLAVVCRDRPLRDVMRQMTRVLGIRWSRLGAGDMSRYEAKPAVRQLAEELDAERTSRAAFGMGRSAPGPLVRDGGARSAPADVMGPPDQVRAALLGRLDPSRLERIEGWLIVRER